MEHFLRNVAAGAFRRELFIFPSQSLLNLMKLEISDRAVALGLNPLVRQSDQTIEFDGNPSSAVLRVAHGNLDRQVAGMEFHKVHGLDLVEKLVDGPAIALNICMRVRL